MPCSSSTCEVAQPHRHPREQGLLGGARGSPELVIAFIPSESLVSSAMEADPGIMDYAFSKNVALASPVSLWSLLKAVAFSRGSRTC